LNNLVGHACTKGLLDKSPAVTLSEQTLPAGKRRVFRDSSPAKGMNRMVHTRGGVRITEGKLAPAFPDVGASTKHTWRKAIMKKWLAAIGAGIIAGIIVWWATQGIWSPVDVSLILSVNENNVRSTHPLEVAGYPIELEIEMQGKGKGAYIHIFHKENIAGSDRYYYQDSTPFFHNTRSIMEIWLGDEKEGIGISYQVVALANRTKSYEPYPETYSELPDDPVATLNMKRVE